MPYDAFISYSHSADGRLAPAVQTGLQRLARPWYKRRALRIFRDETGLSVNPHLWGSIEKALDESRFFVLIASPTAAASQWVNREVEHWLTTKSAETILPVLTDGAFAWDTSKRDFDAAASTALPPALLGAYADEPRFLDLRWARDETQLDLRHSAFRSQMATLAAPIHGVARDDLEGEDIRLHRRALRFAWSAAFVLVLLTLGTALASVLAVRNADAATQRERERVRAQETADQATRRAQSAEVLAERAERDQRRAQTGKASAEKAQRRAESSRQRAETARRLAATQAEQQRIAAEQQRIEAEAARIAAEAAGADASVLRAQSDVLTTENEQAKQELATAEAAVTVAQNRAEDALGQAQDALGQAQTALVSARDAAAVAHIKTLEAKSIDLALLATEPDRLHGNLQEALLLGREAARLDKQAGSRSPTVRGALLTLGLETSRGLRRFLEVPDTSEVGGPFDSFVVTRHGRAAYGAPATNHILIFDSGSSRPTHDIDAGGPVLDLALGANNDVLVAHTLHGVSDEVRMWNLGNDDLGEVLCTRNCQLAVGPGGRTFAVSGVETNLFVDGTDPSNRFPFDGTLGVGTTDGNPPPPPGGTPGPPTVAAITGPAAQAPPDPGSGSSTVSPFSSQGRWALGRSSGPDKGLILWDLDNRATRIALDTLVARHVSRAAFDASGNVLGVALDGTSFARIDLRDSPVVGPITDTGRTVKAIAASSDGAIAAATDDGRVVYVGASSWVWSPDVPTPVTTLAFSPQGKVLSVGSDQVHALTLLDTTDADLSDSTRIVASLPGASRAWFSTDETVAFLETVDLDQPGAGSPTALTVLALARPANGPIARVAPAVIQVFKGHYREFEPTVDGSILVGLGDRVDVFRLDSGAWIIASGGLPISNITSRTWGTLAGSAGLLGLVAVDGDGSVFAVARDGFGALWDAKDFAPGIGVAAPPPNPQPPPFAVPSVTSPDLHFVARSTGEGVELLDRASGRVERTLAQPDNELVTGIRFSPSGSYVLACTGTPQVCEHTAVWRTSDGTLVARLGGVAVMSGDDSTVGQWDASTGRINVFTAAGLGGNATPFRSIAFTTFAPEEPTALTLDGDGRRIAITNGFIHFVWNTADGIAVGRGLGKLPGPDRGATVRAVLSADGRTLAVQDRDGSLQLWDLGARPALRGQLLATLHSSELALSADGSLLATDDPVRVWDTKSLRQIGPTLLDSDASAMQFVPGLGALVVGLGGGAEAAELFTVDRDRLLDNTCRLAGRNLTKEEWTAFGIPLPVQTACPLAGGDHS